MNRILIFDLDGTLLDSLEDIRYALNTALAEAGFPAHDSDSVRSMVGHGLGELVKKALPRESGTEASIQTVLTGVRRIYKEEPVRFTLPYPGIEALIGTLYQNGDILAVLTNKAQTIAQTIVDHFFPGIFKLVRGESPDRPRKPHPQAVHGIIGDLGMPADTPAILIGDSEADIQSALNAGIGVIGVSWGFRSEAELRAAGATRIVHTAGELEKLLTNP